MDTPSTSVAREDCSRLHAINRTSQCLAKFRPDATATRRRNSEPPAQAQGGRGRAEHAPESGRTDAMEQRLAEFREARKRAGLVSQSSTASQGEQTKAAKAEPAAATPKTAMGWLRRFLKWKASPAIMRARPNQAQVRREASTLKPRLRAGPRPRLLALKALLSLCALSSDSQWLKRRRVSSMCVSTSQTRPCAATNCKEKAKVWGPRRKKHLCT